MKTIIVIPARLAASRLPDKPLADICGKPMIARVIERALQTGIKDIVVAVGDKEIIEPANAAGAHAILTDPNLPSGTDRIYAALETFDDAKEYDIVINLQGDMPTFEPSLIEKALAVMVQNPDCDIATLVSPSEDAAEKTDENVVKAILANADNENGAQCLYFTRANAPWGDGPVYRHVGLYVYRREALARFVTAPPSSLEKREKLEQLRALEIGMKIYAGIVSDFPKGVDTLDHLEMAREFYRNQGLQ